MEVPASAPDEAPSFLWFLLILALVLWWLRPYLDRYFAARHKATSEPSEVARQEASPARAEVLNSAPDEAPGTSTVCAPVVQTLEYSDPWPIQPVAETLGLHIQEEFEAVFADAAKLVGEALKVAPQGAAYKQATEGLHRTGDVIDKIFEKWCSKEERLKFSRLREDATIFKTSFSEGTAARSLLCLGGFQREADGIWALPLEDPHATMRALTVRLCLQKHADLQKIRGSQVWSASSNEAVVPKLSSAAACELLVLYEKYCGGMEAPQNSWRERNTEAAVRAKLHERRNAAGISMPMALQEGLAIVARNAATSQRTKVRSQRGDVDGTLTGASMDEVHAHVAKLALPPGYDVVALHCTTDELPHIFGLASTTGKGDDASQSDQAAEVIANEVIGKWSAWRAEQIAWPCATIYGVGVSLDYTINRGFVTAILVGFEGLPPTQELESARQERLRLSKRKAEIPKHPGAPYGAQVHTMDSVQPTPSSSRRRAPPGGG